MATGRLNAAVASLSQIDLSSASHASASVQSDNVEGHSQATPTQIHFAQLCIDYGISQNTLETLFSEQVDTVNVFCALQPDDLDGIGVSLGQKRLLQRLLAELQERIKLQVQAQVTASNTPQGPSEPHAVNPHVSSPANHMQPALNNESNTPCLSAETLRHLGFGGSGETIAYHSVRDFVTMLIDGREVEEEAGIQLPGGDKLLLNSSIDSTKKPKVTSVSPLQWTEGSMRILAKLILEGKIASLEQVAQYAGHIADMARLGQKKTWRSVLLFDESYRKTQAGLNCPWGTRDFKDQRDLILEDRSTAAKNPHAQSKDTRGDAGGRSSRGGRGGQSYSHTADTQQTVQHVQLCSFFQTGTCRRGDVCPHKHFCETCGSPQHGKTNHPVTPATPGSN